jgi:L-ribulose-5-phosphate 3-epimerase
MRLGYNTNGLAHHRLVDAIDLLAEQGYQSVAITLDAGALDPYDDPAILGNQLNAVRSALDRHGLACVVETGARYLLNPRLKHDPTLMDLDPARRAIRLDFLCRAVDLAKTLEADCVSFWSGRAGDSSSDVDRLEHLANAIEPLLRHAEQSDMTLAFEPEPGMFIDTLDRFAQLDERVQHPLFQLTIDLGHVHCLNEGDIPTLLRQWRSRIRNIHIEDMMPGIHEHLMFGEGTMDFKPIIAALGEIGYEQGVHVELSRHSHMGVEAVQRASAFLQPMVVQARQASA